MGKEAQMALADEHRPSPVHAPSPAAPRETAPIWPSENEMLWLRRLVGRLLFAGAIGIILGGLGASIKGYVQGPPMMGWGGFVLGLILTFTRWGRSL